MARNSLAEAALPVLLLATTGCSLFGGSGATPRPAPLEITILASDVLNPDDQGQSLPTVIRVYQLRGTARLENAEADQVYRAPKEALGEDFLSVEEWTLSPGGTVKRSLDREGAARAIAAVALFRRPTASSWRAFAEIPPLDRASSTWTFAAEGYRIERR
jgi:type VI secretion system protein VasD